MHITLIRPPIFSSTNSFSSPVTPPLALAYLSASLRSEKFSVESIDAVGEAIDEVYLFKKPEGHVRGLSIEKILQRIPRETDLIGISCMFSQEWPFVKSLVNSITSKFPDITVMLGGEHITAVTILFKYSYMVHRNLRCTSLKQIASTLVLLSP